MSDESKKLPGEKFPPIDNRHCSNCGEKMVASKITTIRFDVKTGEPVLQYDIKCSKREDCSFFLLHWFGLVNTSFHQKCDIDTLFYENGRFINYNDGF